MANVLQDYFDRMTALNRQRGMTGNMQYGKALDSSLAEGYFDSYEKNKAASEARANQKQQLAIMQQNADTSRMGLDVQRSQIDAYKSAQKNSNMWQGLGMGLNALAISAKAYSDYSAMNRALPMPTTGTTLNGSNSINETLANSQTVGWNEQPYDFSKSNVGNLDAPYFQAQDFSTPTYDNIAVFGDDMDWSGFFS